MSFKICVIGCGRHSREVHGPSLKKYSSLHPDVVLAAVCDLDLARASEFARDFGFARAYTDIGDMVKKEKPDAATVILPTELIASTCRKLLDHGIPLLIEKPPAASPADLELLLKSAEATGQPTQVAFNRRYVPLFVRARTLLDNHTPADTVFRISYDMIRHNRLESDFSETAIHALDSVSFFARSLYRRIDIEYEERYAGGHGVTNIYLSGSCQNGIRVHVAIHPVSGMIMERCVICAEGATLLLEAPLWKPGGSLCLWKNDQLVENYKDPEINPDDLCSRGGFFEENCAFYDSIRQGRTPSPSLKDCFQTVTLMDAIRHRKRGVSF